MEEKEFNAINVIPFIDIMLVLLTIVLTTSTFIAQGMIPVSMPRASKNQAEVFRTQTIEIDRLGQLYLNGASVTIEGLPAKFKDIGRGDAGADSRRP